MGKIGQAKGSLKKFTFFLSSLFFINLVNESLYYCNSCMLEQISYLGKFWFLRYSPKCSWPIRLQDFSINRRTLKLDVSHKEINEMNCFLVCPCNSFLRNGSLGFSDFWRNGRNLNIENSFLTQIWAKRAQNGSKIRFLGFFEKFCHVSLSWK